MRLPLGRAYGFVRNPVSRARACLWARACPRSMGAGAQATVERGQGRVYEVKRGHARAHRTARSARVLQ